MLGLNEPPIHALGAQIDLFKQQAAAKPFSEAASVVRQRLTNARVTEHSLQVGDLAPDFTLPDGFGTLTALSDQLTQGPVVLVFYRGDWCPFCNFTLRAYQAILPQITALYHATLVAVSPQKADFSQLTAQHRQLTYPVLSDLGNIVAHQYRVVWSVGDDLRSATPDLYEYNGDSSNELPMPSTFIIAPNGVIQLAEVYADWTQRTEPLAILNALKRLRDGVFVG